MKTLFTIFDLYVLQLIPLWQMVSADSVVLPNIEMVANQVEQLPCWRSAKLDSHLQLSLLTCLDIMTGYEFLAPNKWLLTL